MTPAEARGRIARASGLNAFIALTDEEGAGPLVAVKDNIDVRGSITTAGGVLLPQLPADRDAQVIGHIRRLGCVVIGKTNLHEWALGVTSDNPHYGRVDNPRAPGRLAGGSSGGSAAAVAAGLCDWAVGTDSGGSIRVPASLCGVVGIRPSVGLVSTEGVFPNSPSFDTVGPLARDVATAGAALGLMVGEVDWAPSTIPAVKDLRLAIPRAWIQDLEGPVAEVWKRVATGLAEIAVPDRTAMAAAFEVVAKVEVAAVHRDRIAEHERRSGADVLARLRAGMQIPAVDYLESARLVAKLQADLDEAMESWDALITPTTPCVAPMAGEPAPDLWGELGRYTRPLSVTGRPAISVPFPTGSLPVGLQLIGHRGRDQDLIAIAAALERFWAGS